MATATKLTGYGNVPGQKQSTPKPIGSGFGGKLPNALSISASQNLPPTFTPQVPTGASYAAAQAGQAPTLGAGGAGTHGDPRDPTYWTDVAKIKQTFDTNTSSYDLQQTQGQTTRDNTLNALDKQQPIDTSDARGNYNKSGLFYSSKLTGAVGDLASQYDTKRGDARSGFANLVDQLNILRNTNQNTYGTGSNGALTGTAYLDALNAGIGRQSEADRAAANANSLVAPTFDQLSRDPTIDWKAVAAAFGPKPTPKPTLSAGGSSAQKTTGSGKITSIPAWARKR